MSDMKWLQAEYASRKSNAEAHVVDWQPYSDEAFDLRPLYFESHRYRRGNRLDPNRSSTAPYRYGVDGDGRIWVEQQATEFRGQQYETFWVHGPDGPQEAVGYNHSPDKRPIFLDRFNFVNGLLVGYEKQAQQGCKRSRYVYDGKRLMKIEHAAGPTPADLKPFQIEDITFDALGRLEQIVCHQLDSNGRETGAEIRFKARPRQLSTKELKQIFLDRFVAAVPAAIAALPDNIGAAYCLALAYDPGQFSTLPPTLGLGLKERLGEPSYEAWNPATMLQTELTRDRFPELSSAADLLDQGPLSEAHLRSLLNEAAVRLAGLDWTGVMPVTTDFIVYATDLELSHLVSNLRKVLGQERFAELRRSGSLPS